MKKNLKKYSKITFFSVFFIVSAILIYNRYSFGVWNPFSLPERIECYNRRYYISTFAPKTLNENEESVNPISFSDSMSIKDLYTKDPKGEYVPTVIYLKVSDHKYQTYALSGGP